jgi:hypothetical protein
MPESARVPVVAVQSLSRVRFEKTQHGASVSGFDHFQALMTCLVGFFVIASAFAAVIFSFRWGRLLPPCAAAFAVIFVLAQFLRFRFVLARDAATLERSWAGIVYSRRQVADIRKLVFIVNGTGDFGDEGPWPGSHYCEIGGLGFSDAFIGSPAAAQAICNFLSDERTRLLRGA